jgi:signal transduction histidine kinase/CheY-like chemotaxis protein
MRLFVLFCLLSFIFSYSAFARDIKPIKSVPSDVHSMAQQQEHSIILADGPIEIHLQHSMQWLKADYQSFSLGQLQLASTPDFKSLEFNPFMQGNESYWLRFQVINPLSHSLPLALSLSDNAILVEGAYRLENSKWQRIDELKKEQRLSGRSALVLNFQGNSNQWIYLRLQPLQNSNLKPVLQNLEQYNRSLSYFQIMLGTMIALMVFVALLHIIAIRFDNHVRHYLVVYLALVAGICSIAQLPLSQTPSWLDQFFNLLPWLLSVGLSLSSFSTNTYQKYLKSNRCTFILLAALLVTLLLYNAHISLILSCALLPCLFVLSRISNISLSLSVSNITLLMLIIWQLAYFTWPESVLAPNSLSSIFAITATIFLASMSIILPYFQRQSKRHAPNKIIRNNNFLSHISHELRSPMNGVLGMSELLNETPLSHTQRDYVGTIESAGEDILRIVDRISDYAKITSGNLQLEYTQEDLAQFVEDVLQRFQHSAHQQGIELILNLGGDIPEIITTDKRRLHTLIDFLLENALNHTEHGEVELSIKWDPQSNQQNLIFTIRDTGPGMRKEALKNMFTTADKINGVNSDQPNTNFFMTLCKQLTKLMGGEMFVQSTLGLGSTFSFSIPYEATSQIATKPGQVKVLQGLSMLIVDDNSTLRKVVQTYAKSWGMHADATYSGKEALAMLRNQANLKTPYDIVLIDQNMPFMDGFQLAKRIKEDDDINQNVLKIMLTGLAISSKHKDVMQAGIHQVISKPVSARALQQVLAQRIQQKNMMKPPYS